MCYPYGLYFVIFPKIVKFDLAPVWVVLVILGVNPRSNLSEKKFVIDNFANGDEVFLNMSSNAMIFSCDGYLDINIGL